MKRIVALLFFALPYGICPRPPTELYDMSKHQQRRWVNYYLNRHPVADTDPPRSRYQPRRDVGGSQSGKEL